MFQRLLLMVKKIEYTDNWNVVTPYHGYSDIEFTLLNYIQDKENKIEELQERMLAIENEIRELERIRKCKRNQKN